MTYISLIEKLDAFVRKYYRNKALKGILIATATVTAGFLLFAFIEYIGRFGVLGRTILFWSFSIATLGVIGKMILIPLMHLARLGRIISHEEASRIVGDHFPEVKDKLLNTLQLQGQIDNSSESENQHVELLIASVEQRTFELSPISFTSAIDLRENARYLKYAIGPLVILLSVLLWKPSVVSEPAERLIQHRTSFEAPAPFRFVVVSIPLKAPVGEDFDLLVKVEGSTVPATIYLEEKGNRYRMERLKGGIFRYVFSSLKADATFRLSANGWSSSSYTLLALPVPTVLEFTLNATPPHYTGVNPIVQTNHGDIVIPEGTAIKWECRVKDTDNFGIRVGDSLLTTENITGHLYMAHWVANKTIPYWLIPKNKELGAVDSLRFALRVIADRRPVIKVIELEDSTTRQLRYFSGGVNDDYGFSKLAFAVKRAGEKYPSYTLLDRPSGKSDEFFFTWDMTSLELSAGDAVEYWLEVWDNDAINGAKSSKTSTRVFSAPNENELLEERDEANEEIEASIEDAVERAEELRREMEAFKERLREEREMDWQDKRALEELLEKQEELRKNIDEVKKANEIKNEKLNEFSPQKERIMEKQNELQKLMDEVMSDELRELYQKMQELMDDMNPDEIQKQLEKMDVGQDALEKELDRALEQFKQLEWEVKMDETVEKLKELAEKQQDLAEKTENEESTSEELKSEQDSLNKAFEDIQKKIDELEKDNKKLENPNPMLDSEDDEKSIQEDQKESSEELDKGKEKKASEKQKSAAKKMEDLAQRMQSMQMQSEEEDDQEDMDALRALLENIISLSFDEESLMGELGKTENQDPRYVTHGQTQRALKDDAKMVADSLFALSLRVRQLAGAVNREIGLVNHHMEKALGGFGDRKTSDIIMNQQYVMTSFNNLALLLDEALQQMQKKQECKNPGSGNCNKPGGSGSKPSPKAGDMKKMQEALGKKLEAMKKKMGDKANQGESGKRGSGMSKELAEMAAQQAALREMAKQKAQELNEDGSGDGGEMKKIAQEMEELERDLINRDVDIATLERQRNILSRLLEAEEAERIRGEKDERKSRVGDQTLHPDSPQMIDYLKNKANEIELLRTVPADLVPYYRDKVNDYFNILGDK
ncbi:MAG: hypothetical protein COA49_02820 [Bacteroidetes bacterium]|nr:MAG: hypothetical protein COA49_02820 [Bacteroidota bacterium]